MVVRPMASYSYEIGAVQPSRACLHQQEYGCARLPWYLDKNSEPTTIKHEKK